MPWVHWEPCTQCVLAKVNWWRETFRSSLEDKIIKLSQSLLVIVSSHHEGCSVQLIKTYQLIKSNLLCVWHCMEFCEGFGLYCYYWQIRCIKPVHWKDLCRRQFWHSTLLYWCYFFSKGRCFSLSSPFRTSLTVLPVFDTCSSRFECSVVHSFT